MNSLLEVQRNCQMLSLPETMLKHAEPHWSYVLLRQFVFHVLQNLPVEASHVQDPSEEKLHTGAILYSQFQPSPQQSFRFWGFLLQRQYLASNGITESQPKGCRLLSLLMDIQYPIGKTAKTG